MLPVSVVRGGGVSTLVVASCSSYYTMYLVVLLQEIEAGNAYLAITAINLLTSLHGMQTSKYFKDGAYDRKRARRIPAAARDLA